MERNEILVGQHVRLAAWSDLWMRGLRYGRVSKVGRKYAQINRLGTADVYRVPFGHIESVLQQPRNV